MSAAVQETADEEPKPHRDAKPHALARRDRVETHRIERVVEQTPTQVSYIARDTATSHEVLLVEYLPADLVVRHADGRIAPREPGLTAAFALGCRRFTQHATRLTRFDHPSLPHLYRCWEANGSVYAAMKNQRGATLMAARPAMERPPEEAWLRVLVNHLLEALDTLHEAGVVHGGVAPRCIVLRRDGPTLLTDTSDAVSPSDQADAAAFVAPELRLGAEDMSVGPWTDLWGLAASLHYAITGTVHVEGQTMPDSLRVLRGDFPQLRYSEALLRAIDNALASASARRPQSVAAFRDAIGLPGAVRRSSVTVPGSFDTVAQATDAATPPATPPATGPATGPGPLSQPPTLDDAVAEDGADSVSPQERSAIDSALSGFGPIASRPAPMQSAHAPGAYEPIEAPVSRLRLLGIGVALACLLAVVGVAAWQLVEKQQADGVVRASSVGTPPQPPLLAEPAPLKPRNRSITGPEGRDINIPAPAKRP